MKEVCEHVSLTAHEWMFLCARDGGGRDVDADDFIGSRSDGAGIVAVAAAGDEHAPTQRELAKCGDKLGMRDSFLPSHFAGLVECFPIAHGLRLQMLACATLH